MTGRRQRVGLFGGSFDPIHRGHVEVVAAARRELAIDRVVYLPTARPPHKPGDRFAPPLARYCMVELALLDDPLLEVDTFELEHDGPAYTIDTVELYRRRLPEAELCLFLGADSYLELDQWRRFRDLIAMTTLVVLPRPGFELEGERNRWRGARVLWPRTPPVDLSSTSLRRRLAGGEHVPAEELAPSVLSFIRKYSLYS